MSGLTKGQVLKVVNRYIGVHGGYLGDFSYGSHAEFYLEFCGLDITPSSLQGTTRQRFIQILSDAAPAEQAKILRGVLLRFPVGAENSPETRTPEEHAAIEQMILDLSNGPRIESPSLATRSQAVDQALRDAETLIAQQGATSAVDRVHTALHAYLADLCASAGISVAEDASVTSLFKTLRLSHPALKATGPRSEDIEKILRAFAAILDALNPLRNWASLAHPQSALLAQPEAMVVVHAVRTVLHYIEARLRVAASNGKMRSEP